MTAASPSPPQEASPIVAKESSGNPRTLFLATPPPQSNRVGAAVNTLTFSL